MSVLLMLGLSVALGAFGAHALKKIMSPEKLSVYHTACNYLTSHSIALLVVLVINITTNFTIRPKSIYSLLSGIIIFCSALYLVSLSEIMGLPWLSKFGMVAPIGGLLIILGYLLTALDIYKTKKL